MRPLYKRLHSDLKVDATRGKKCTVIIIPEDFDEPVLAFIDGQEVSKLGGIGSSDVRDLSAQALDLRLNYLNRRQVARIRSGYDRIREAIGTGD